MLWSLLHLPPRLSQNLFWLHTFSQVDLAICFFLNEPRFEIEPMATGATDERASYCATEAALLLLILLVFLLLLLLLLVVPIPKLLSRIL